MSDDKQQPRKRIRIPTPKELDEAAGGEQSEQKAPQEQKRGRFRIRRSPMRIRGGVGQNKKVLKAPRPDAKPVREAPPDGHGTGSVDLSLSKPSSNKRVTGDEDDQVRQDAVPSGADTGTDSDFKDKGDEEDKPVVSPRSRVRTVTTSPKLKKRKEEPVPDEDTKRLLSREEQARMLARRNAQENGHDIGDFVEQVRQDRNKSFKANCKKCVLYIVAVVAFDNFDVKGTPQVVGTAKGTSCPGKVRNHSSGTS